MNKIILFVVSIIIIGACENYKGQNRHNPDHHNDKKTASLAESKLYSTRSRMRISIG
jgi:hypothetical protein